MGGRAERERVAILVQPIHPKNNPSQLWSFIDNLSASFFPSLYFSHVPHCIPSWTASGRGTASKIIFHHRRPPGPLPPTFARNIVQLAAIANPLTHFERHSKPPKKRVSYTVSRSAFIASKHYSVSDVINANPEALTCLSPTRDEYEPG